MEKDYSLLRPFDLDAAKRGEAVCYGHTCNYKEVKFIAEAGPDGDHAIRGEEGNLIFSREQYLRMAPLCWVEGKPVYKGDVLWTKDGRQKYVARPDFLPEHDITWPPPKVKREGWVNIHGPAFDEELHCAFLSHAFHTKEIADNYASSNGARIACIHIEWEE